MTYNEKHDIALLRYSAIAPAVNETLPAGQSLHAFFADAAGHPCLLPNGQTRKFAPATMERWYRQYKRAVSMPWSHPAGKMPAEAGAWMMMQRNLYAT